MAAAAPNDADVRSIIRSILVSNPNEMTARFLDRDFTEMEGYPIPYHKFGFKSLLDYLRSIPDTVTVMGPAANPVILPVTTEKSAHVEKMVLKQRKATSNRMPARRPRNHVSANKNRIRKNGSVSHMPQNGPLAKSFNQLTLPGSSNEIIEDVSDKSRIKINIPCLKRHILCIKRLNDKPVTKTRADGAPKNNNSDNSFKARSEIDPGCLQEQINSFKEKNNYSSYKVNEYTTHSSQYESNCRKEAAKQGGARNSLLGHPPPQPLHERTQPTSSATRIPSIFELKFDPNMMEKLRGGGGPSFNGSRNFHHPVWNHRPDVYTNFIPAYPFPCNSNPYGQPLFQSPPNVSFQPSRPIEPNLNHSNVNSAKPLASPAVPPPSARQKPPASNTSYKDPIVDNNNVSWMKNSGNTNLCPAGSENARSPDPRSPDTYFFGSRSDDGSAAENDYVSSRGKRSGASLIPAGAESLKNENEGRLSHASKSDGSVISDYDDTPISSKMKENFRTLLRRNPDGFFCSELPALYKTEFNAPFCCQEYGYNSVIQMVSEHPNIFSFTRSEKNGDWLLKPPGGNGQNKSDKSLKRWVPMKVVQNILRILEQFPGGLPMSQLLDKYKEFVNESFDFRQYGETLEVVINDMENDVHQRRAGKEILLYEASKLKKCVLEGKPLPSTPALPNIEINLLHKDLYPDECCDYNDVIPVQQLPDLERSRFVEVRVSDLENPDRMWFQLGRCYDALVSMMRDLHQFYTNFGSEYVMHDLTVRPRQLCACLFGDGGNERWHRAIIQSYNKDEVKVTVEYIDYGTKLDVHRSILRFLHKDFSKLHCQAIRGRLLSVYPPVGCKEWPRTTNQHLLALTGDRRLMLEVVNQLDNLIEGFLYDTNGDEDIVINDELVSSGHATMRKNHTDHKSSGSPILEPVSPQLNSPNPSAKSDKTLPWYCSPKFDDNQTPTSQTFKYYDTNTTTTFTDSSTGYYSPSKGTTQLPSSSPPNVFTSGTSTSGYVGSLSPHSGTASMSPHSRHSNSPDIIYYGSAEHLNKVPLGTSPLSNTSSKFLLNRSLGTHSSSSLQLSSNPSSPSPKLETAGDQSFDMTNIPSLANYSNPPFTLTTTTVTTAPPTFSAPAAAAASLQPPFKRPPPGFGTGIQQNTPVNNLPFGNNYMPPVENNWNILGQYTAVNQAQQLMMQRLPPMQTSYLFPNYPGMGLAPPVYPMLNSMNCQLNQAVNFPNHNTNTFTTNTMYPNTMFPTRMPHSSNGPNVPTTLYPQHPNTMPPMSMPHSSNGPNVPTTLYPQHQNTVPPMSMPHSSNGLNVPTTLYPQYHNTMPPMSMPHSTNGPNCTTLYPQHPNTMPPMSMPNSSNGLNVSKTLNNQGQFASPSVMNQCFNDETLLKAEILGNVDVGAKDLSASPSSSRDVYLASSTPTNLTTVESVRSTLNEQLMSNPSTDSDLNVSSGSVETVTASFPVSSSTEATYITCNDTESVCSDWEAEADETVTKETDLESVDSDVDTDASVKGAPSTSLDCPQPSVVSAAGNQLTDRTSKPKSRSARKRQRKSMLKNKEKGLVATLPVIADTGVSTETALSTTDDVSSSIKESGKENKDSAATSESKAKNETKDTSNKNKNNKSQVQNGKAQVSSPYSTIAEKVASRKTSLRRPKDKGVLLEISQEVSKSNASVPDEKTSADEIKTEKLTVDETKNLKSSANKDKNGKSSVHEKKSEISRVDKEKNKNTSSDEVKSEKSSEDDKSNVDETKNLKSSANKDKNGKSSVHEEQSETSSVDKEKNKKTSSDEVKSGKSSEDDKSCIVEVNNEKSSTDRVKDDESSVEVKNVSESGVLSSKSGVKDSKSDEKAIKKTLVKDWKLLDNITKDSIYVSKPVKGNSSKTVEENPRSDCDMIDRIISSVGAHVFNTAEAEITQSTPKEQVQKKVVDNKTIHVFEYNNQPTVCTDEVITSFSKFTKRNAVNKALDWKQAVKPYFDIMRKNNAQLFKLLDACKISGITKDGETQIPDKLSVLPLENVSNLLKNLEAVPSVVDSFSDLSKELNAL